MPLDLKAGQIFLALDNLQEQKSQRGSSPEDTESSLIMFSITNTEQQSEQRCYSKTREMISHLFSSKKYLQWFFYNAGVEVVMWIKQFLILVS